MTARTRLEKLEKARQAIETAARDAYISSLTIEELETIVRDTANLIRSGKMSKKDIEAFVILARLEEDGGLEAWLQSVELPRPGDAAEMERLEIHRATFGKK